MLMGRRVVLGAAVPGWLCASSMDALNPREEREERELQLSLKAARGVWGSRQLFLKENVELCALKLCGGLRNVELPLPRCWGQVGPHQGSLNRLCFPH